MSYLPYKIMAKDQIAAKINKHYPTCLQWVLPSNLKEDMMAVPENLYRSSMQMEGVVVNYIC